ncbi:hypothetical protein ACX02_13220 [Vibrio parahaemolyticus]|uniref:MarR family transcriptional regulator n=1 Tax=Vibrio parahaemolyticus TaxID=670 RepID=A0AAW3IZU4_VIBPH|nr:hypothetical protein ACX02_13220 [Vibrio parahaemolyticus]KOY35453.1 hypothetical protein ACX05_07675 [Vibrio parahaemolyticus]TOQ37413.1 hypothetical protein CGG96_21885 [Vibrio parahaemolyticus]
MEGYSLKYDEKGDVTQTFVLFTPEGERCCTAIEKIFKEREDLPIMVQNVVNNAIICLLFLDRKTSFR